MCRAERWKCDDKKIQRKGAKPQRRKAGKSSLRLCVLALLRCKFQAVFFA
jgi:hypothetical protein